MTTDVSRPRDLALLMLASSHRPPRQRARDQQADLAGMALQRRVLARLIGLDPANDAVESALNRIVQEIGPPSGPSRAVAASIRDELQALRRHPSLLEQLLDHAVDAGRAAEVRR